MRFNIGSDPNGHVEEIGDALPDIHNTRTIVQRMDVLKMLTELRQELAQIDEAILTMERLAQGAATKPRGRRSGSKNKPREKLLSQVVAGG